MKINEVSPQSHNYLKLLDSIATPPKSLYLIGTLPEERRASVAIVGTRKPSSYGKEVTQRLAYELAKRGIVIISGLALGVDSIAHQAALDAGGTTIAILGNGLPDIYPRNHKNLADQIIRSGGAIISEYAPGTSAMGFRFLERNRLVSGLADAVIITEAATRSGTMSTAAHALEQGRVIFAVPGNITSPLSAGCNALLRQGATPATQPSDIIEAIAPNLLQPQAALPLGNTSAETTIIELLQSGVRDGDELQRKSRLTAPEMAEALTMLEIAGVVRPLGANQWALR